MKPFRTQTRDCTDKEQSIFAAYEIAHTAVDFSAALFFLIGSVLFFWPAWETVAVWFFVIGSLFFLMKPTLRLVREVHLYRLGDVDQLAKRLKD